MCQANKSQATKIGVTAVPAAAMLAMSHMPTGAITAELAKKCRDEAIKAHPPQPAGTLPYAEAEREVFRDCVAKGQYPSTTGAAPRSPDTNKRPATTR
jgi:hypothetical protein